MSADAGLASRKHNVPDVWAHFLVLIACWATPARAEVFTTVLKISRTIELTIRGLFNTEAAGATAVAAHIARTAFEVSEAPLHDLPAPAREMALAIAGKFDSGRRTSEFDPCAAKRSVSICQMWCVERRVFKREAPFVYAINRDTMVRFIQRCGPSIGRSSTLRV